MHVLHEVPLNTFPPRETWRMVPHTQVTLSYEWVFYNVLYSNNTYLSVVPCCLRILSDTRPGGSESFRRTPSTSESPHTGWTSRRTGLKVWDPGVLGDLISQLPVEQDVPLPLTLSQTWQDRSRENKVLRQDKSLGSCKVWMRTFYVRSFSSLHPARFR